MASTATATTTTTATTTGGKAVAAARIRTSGRMEVDVIVPVYNASNTLRDTIASAMNQVWLCRRRPPNTTNNNSNNKDVDDVEQQTPQVSVHVCCYNDASTDESWAILQELQEHYSSTKNTPRRSNNSNTNNSNTNNSDTTNMASTAPPKSVPETSSSAASSSLTSSPPFVSSSSSSRAVVAVPIPSKLWIATSPPGCPSRGAGYARNRAVELRRNSSSLSSLSVSSPRTPPTTTTAAANRYLCWLDSDDLMHPTRVYHQLNTFLQMLGHDNADTSTATKDEDDAAAAAMCRRRRRTLVGTPFDRIPSDATLHYTAWANALSPERMQLERYREIPIIQPTWMMTRERFELDLGGYLEAPPPPSSSTGTTNETFSVEAWVRDSTLPPLAITEDNDKQPFIRKRPWRLVHDTYETATTLRVAEDLRLFHEHLCQGGRLERTIVQQQPRNEHGDIANETAVTDNERLFFPSALVSYRHSGSGSQSGQTSRKLLLHLRVAAFDKMVLSRTETETTTTHSEETQSWGKFIVWGAGRDGKDFVKALPPSVQQRVYCMLDVDHQKIARGYYVGGTDAAGQIKIPVVHFSLAARDSKIRAQLYHAWKHEDASKTKKANETGDNVSGFGRINKDNSINPFNDGHEGGSYVGTQNETKRGRVCSQNGATKKVKIQAQTLVNKDPGVEGIDLEILPNLPVVVCVAMYRTNGALENNVRMIGRREGLDMWHFS